MAKEVAVQVAVRCRPFLSKIDGDRDKFVCGVEMEGPSTRIFDPETGESRKFTFDYSYWSFGESDSHYVGNEEIYQDMGVRVLDTAWEGYNVSLFAYGQTGSGKSYSMIGIDSDPGIVPKVSEEIFRRIKKLEAEQDEKNVGEYERIHFEVTCSMLEIYNEKVRDLLNAKKTPAAGLKIRESKATGPFVEGLTHETVRSYEEIEQTMAEGTKMRTVRATKMNDTSSRAHTLVTITLKQKKKNKKGAKKKWSERISKINLVDLAGSEKQRNTGTSGQGQREGIAINQSLSYLGKCITSLAKRAGGNRKIVVPYRESKLTFIMKESLGGNSRTIMIAAIRPGAHHFTESLSTLRYANEAKKIKNKAVVNEDPKEKAIRELKEQVAQLKKQLAEGGGVGSSVSDNDDDEVVQDLQEKLKQSNEIIEQLRISEEEAAARNEEIKRLREESLKAAGLGEDFDRKEHTYILNMTEDPSQFGVIAYALDKDDELLGRAKSCDITLSGLGIMKEHCRFVKEGEQWYLIPFPENSDTHLNGIEATAKTALNHNDRLIFGNSHIFKFIIPSDPKFDDKHVTADCEHDWAAAQAEYAEQKGLIDAKKKAEQEAAYAAKMAEMERKFKEQQEEMERQRKAMEADLVAKEEALKAAKNEEERMALERAQLEEQERQRKIEEELIRKQRESEERIANERRRAKERESLEAQIIQLLPLIKDANSIAKEMGKKVTYELKVYQDFEDDWSNTPVTRIGIITKQLDTNLTTMWDEPKFRDRQFVMKDMYSEYVDAEEDGRKFRWESDDPFEDEDFGDPQVCGHALVYLKSLSYLVDNEVYTGIINVHGKQEGEMKVKLIPCDASGNEENVDFIEESKELLGRELFFKIQIPYARGLNKNRCEDPFCRFRLPTDLEYSETKPVFGRENNPEWNYERLVHINPVTPQFLDYIENSMLKIEVLAKQCTDRKKKRASEYEKELRVKDAQIQEVKMNLKYILEQRNDLELETSQLQTELDQVLSELEELQTGFFDEDLKLASPNNLDASSSQFSSEDKAMMEKEREAWLSEKSELLSKLKDLESRASQNPEAAEKSSEQSSEQASEQASNVAELEEEIAKLKKSIKDVKMSELDHGPRLIGYSGKLTVTLNNGTSLANRSVDPYVSFKLGSQKHRSKTIKNSKDPSWSDSFVFDIDHCFEQVISFKLYDDDLASSDDLLGTGEIRLIDLFHNRVNSLVVPVTANAKNSDASVNAKLSLSLIPEGFGIEVSSGLILPSVSDMNTNTSSSVDKDEDDEVERLRAKLSAQAAEIKSLRDNATSSTPGDTSGESTPTSAVVTVDQFDKIQQKEDEIRKLREHQKEMELKLKEAEHASNKKSSVCVVM